MNTYPDGLGNARITKEVSHSLSRNVKYVRIIMGTFSNQKAKIAKYLENVLCESRKLTRGRVKV